IGLYPVYYHLENGNLLISNSIILIASITGEAFDEVGILQRSIGQDFSNIGSRTILENCKRILPGEYIKFNSRGEILEKKYDNSLYQSISSSNQDHQFHKKYWEDYKKEVKYCLNNSGN